MTRWAVIFIVMLAALSAPVTVGAGAGSEGKLDGSLPSRADSEWLMLVYMAADNNLGENKSYGNAAWFDLEEIEGNMSTSGLDILVLVDMKGDHNTVLYDLEYHPVVGIGSPTIPLSDVNPLWSDELDTSDPDVLRDFLVYGMTERSADNVLIDIWDHGTGWYSSTSRGNELPGTRGFAQDVTNGATMYMDDIRDAFSEASGIIGGLHSDIIVFDTCYMGSLEVMYQMSPWADIGMGAEDQQPFYGLNYTFTDSMGGIDPLDPINLTKLIIERYSTTYDPAFDPWAGYSAVDMQILRTDFISSLDNLSRNLFERMYHLEVDLSGEFHQAYSRAVRIGGSSSSLDLGDLLENIVQRDMDEIVTDWAERSLANYTRMMIAETHFANGNNPGATGLTVYFPSKYGYYQSIYDGSTGYLNLTADTYWEEMVKEYRSPVERVRINATVVALNPDMVYDDLRIHVTNPEVSPDEPVPDAVVYLDGTEYGTTDTSGLLFISDLEPDRYDILAVNGTHLGFATVKMSNQAPVISADPGEPETGEGEPIFIDASGSYDPDGDPIYFEWDLDLSDGFHDVDSTFPGVSLTFDEQGSYEIRLTVSDGISSVSENMTVKVHNLPPRAVISAPVSTREDESFDVSGGDSIDSYPDELNLRYRFSIDGLNATDWSLIPDASLSIEKAGEHEIGLWVMDPDGDMDYNGTIIDVFNVRPSPSFTGPESAWEGEQVIFKSSPAMDTPSDISDLNISWIVNGDISDISYGPEFVFNRSISGIYTITMEVVDDDGASESNSSAVLVQNIVPEAEITGPKSAFEDEIVNLSSFGSTDSPSDLITMNYSWDVDSDGEPDLFGAGISVRFTKGGIHTVVLTITDDDGDHDTALHEITIRNRAPDPVLLGPERIDEDEIAVFSLADSFDSESDMGLISFEWSVDGVRTGSNESILSTVFRTEGNHTVSVKLTDDQGETGSAVHYINVTNPAPTVIISDIPTKVRRGEEFTILGYKSHDTKSDMDALVFIWILDGSILRDENGRNLTISIDSAGMHNISLLVIDDEGAQRQTNPIEFEVEDYNIAVKIVGFLITPLGLMLAGILIILIIMVIFQLRKKVGELPDPVKEDSGIPLDDSESGEEDMIDPIEPDIDPEPETDDIVDETEDEDPVELVELDIPDEMDDIPKPGLAPIPAPPDIEDMEDFPEVGEDD
ncbi:MAG: PKD domain-containing protein [Thermoplasmatota archaeon]